MFGVGVCEKPLDDPRGKCQHCDIECCRNCGWVCNGRSEKDGRVAFACDECEEEWAEKDSMDADENVN